MDTPLVSVITITRNRGQLISRCIKSVLTQSYNNIEYLIVDGASEDNTDEVVSSFKDERLHYYRLKYNWPIKETLDFAISKCSGKYITFLDSDDEYLPTKIARQVSLIESLTDDYGFVYCWMTYWNSETGIVDRHHDPRLRGFVPSEAVASPVISGTPSLLFRSEVLRSLGGWKSQDEIGIISDWELCARACQKYKIDYVDDYLVNVYINHYSIRQSDSSYYDAFIKRNIVFHEYFLSYFDDTFKQTPKSASLHYQLLARYYSKIHDRKKALKYLCGFFRVKPFSFLSIPLLFLIIIGK